MARPLTNIQAQVLAAIRARVDRGEGMPTYRDLRAEFGWSSTGTVRGHLKALASKGFVDLAGRRGHRQLRLRDEPSPAVRVPLVGRVAAGIPILAEENVEGRIPVPSEWIKGGTYFALRVSGDSMIGAGIFDGDQVVVREQQVASDGDIVVATLDAETTLKRLRRDGRRVMLVAENPRFEPIEVQTESALVQGVVVGLLRAYGPTRMARARQRPIRGTRHTQGRGTSC